MTKKHWNCAGPILLSALSLLNSFFIIQPLALFFGPEFNLLASRGIGKVAFISMVIFQVLLFMLYQPPSFLKNFLDRVVLFFVKERWFPLFASLFSIFFIFHSIVLLIFYIFGMISFSPIFIINPSVIGKLLFGLFVAFMLAWTEELIFRGTIFPYFEQFYSTVPSIILTSLIFMLVHNLKNPLMLLSYDWKLGLGLFLLGVLLNQVFVITRKLYAGMGVHAGLVFVKVVLRRIPFLSNVPDLRQSYLVHILFLLTIVTLFIVYRKKFDNQSFSRKLLP